MKANPAIELMPDWLLPNMARALACLRPRIVSHSNHPALGGRALEEEDEDEDLPAVAGAPENR